MHSLVGTFLKDVDNEVNPKDDQIIYPIKIVLPPSKSRVVYFPSADERVAWANSLKQAIGYSNLFDFYDLFQTLGQGQFGMVKLAIHKKTGEKVAIKIVKKKDMNELEVYQQRREIEVLKMCQHPNIIKLIDLFENADYYYLVMDYMQGGDMFDYLQLRKFKISENRARDMTRQILLAIQYLHSYGMLHRDLKLENVMMTDKSEGAIPKIADFGLTKIIGPSEKANEPFGTVGYVAPEVLKKEPYTFSCDVWGIGCIAFALLSGTLPFDSED